MKLRERLGFFGWESAHAAVSRRPPISLSRVVARAEGYTCDANVWDLSLVQRPFSVGPRQTLLVRFATFAALKSPLPPITRLGWFGSRRGGVGVHDTQADGARGGGASEEGSTARDVALRRHVLGGLAQCVSVGPNRCVRRLPHLLRTLGAQQLPALHVVHVRRPAPLSSVVSSVL
jgi:hypothetical protein